MSDLLPEFAGNAKAVIEPSSICGEGTALPSMAILCFFGDLLESMCHAGDLVVIQTLRSEMGEHPIYSCKRQDKTVAVFHPGIGSSMAAAGLEQIIALGARDIIACGGAGVLSKDLAPGSVIVPTGAVRDEGTSYHYQPRSRHSHPHLDAVRAIEAACGTHQTPVVKGLTWTTDAIFRETPTKIASRKAEGCLTVEMEASALFAVAQFRGIRLGQLLYAGDDVSGRDWDQRRQAGRLESRSRLLALAFEAVTLLGLNAEHGDAPSS